MPRNFIECDRKQDFLLPPNLREWLADDNLAWFVVEEEMDIAAFYGAHRCDGWGRAAFEAKVMVSLLLSAYAVVSVGLVALNRSLIAGNASQGATRSYRQNRAEVERMLEEAAPQTCARTRSWVMHAATRYQPNSATGARAASTEEQARLAA